jgi:phage tail sheath gpL-like
VRSELLDVLYKLEELEIVEEVMPTKTVLLLSAICRMLTS